MFSMIKLQGLIGRRINQSARKISTKLTLSRVLVPIPALHVLLKWFAN